MATTATLTKKENKNLDDDSVTTAQAQAQDKTQDRESRKQSNRVADRTRDIRRVEAIDDMMGIEPNKITTKQPEFITVNPREVWIDGSYQRDVGKKGMKLILDIVENFSWSKFKPPVLTRDVNGRYLAIDGQHTLIGAASHPELDKIPAIFIPLKDVKDQAAAFVAHNTAKVNVPSIDLFYADLARDDEEAVVIYELMKKNAIELLRYLPGAAISQYEARTTVATGALKRVYRKHGKAKLDEIMRISAECEFKPIRSDHIRALAELLYGRKEERGQIDTDLLIEMIQSLNDTESLMQAQRIASSTQVSKSVGLAVYWRNRYYRLYS